MRGGADVLWCDFFGGEELGEEVARRFFDGLEEHAGEERTVVCGESVDALVVCCGEDGDEEGVKVG